MKRELFLKSQRGSTLIFFVFLFTLIAACSTLVMDIGATVIEKSKISNACDSAVLAGASELENNPGNALNVAMNYLKANGINGSEANIEISGDNKNISVTINRKVEYTFAKLIGFKSGNVKVTSTASIRPITGVSNGIRPFAINNQTLVYGQNYVLKEGAGSGSTGNYDLLALGGKGANLVSFNIVEGYSGTLRVGESIDTQPGNMAGPVTSSVQSLIYQDPSSTYDNYKLDSPRIITVIVVDSINVSGSKPVTICGFASFFLEAVSGTGGNAQIVGKFIKTVASGETSASQTDYGLVGIKLTK